MNGVFRFKYLVYARNGLPVSYFVMEQGRPSKRQAHWLSSTPVPQVDLFAGAVRQLDAGNDGYRVAEPFKAEHDVRPGLDVVILLLDHVV
jgi:hypothetical protein